jgi:hypothetical protein
MALVQNLVERRHLYCSAAITARYYDRASGRGLPPRHGTAWVVWGNKTGRFFVTNRHVLDAEPPAAFDRVELSGHVQPDDQNADTVPWTYTHHGPEVVLHPDPDTDLALIRVPLPSHTSEDPNYREPQRWSAQGDWYPSFFDLNWLASDTELRRLLPGDQIFISGYPGTIATVAGGQRPMTTGPSSSAALWPAIHAIPRRLATPSSTTPSYAIRSGW